MVRRTTPVRTCVGCRSRAAKPELLRVVAVSGALVPDPRGRLPGRGASLHLDLGCLDLAERRRAFGRALRLAEPPDVGSLRAYVEEQVTVGRTDSAAVGRSDDSDSTDSADSSTSTTSAAVRRTDSEAVESEAGRDGE